MKGTWIERLDAIQKNLEELLIEVKPDNDGEWNALEKMITSHKTLRSIDRTPLSQQRMDLK